MFLLGFARNFLEKFIVFFPYKNLQLVYPPYDMARLMRIPMPNAMGVATTQAPLRTGRMDALGRTDRQTRPDRQTRQTDRQTD